MKWFFLFLSARLFAAEPTCQILGGEYHGILQQNQNPVWQWVQLKLSAKTLAHHTCSFEGSVDLVFGDDAASPDRKRFEIEASPRRLPGKREEFFILLTSNEKDGVVLELLVGPKGFTAGNFYSKTTGFLGSIRIAKGVPQKSSANFVPSLNGSYAPNALEGLRLRLQIDHTSNGVGKQGEIVDSQSGEDVITDVVYSVTRETQTGWVVIETENRLLVGYTTSQGLQLFNPMSNIVGPCPHCMGSRLFGWNRLKFIR